jgi:hypothetical protein
MSKSLATLDDSELEARAELVKRIQALQDEEVNDWEMEFLESIEKVVLSGNDLTIAQQEKLDQIEDRIENGGGDYNGFPIPY